MFLFIILEKAAIFPYRWWCTSSAILSKWMDVRIRVYAMKLFLWIKNKEATAH